MAYILPNSLTVTPQTPDTQTTLTFNWQGSLDLADQLDVLNILGFNTVVYILYRPSNSASWSGVLGTYDCNGCYNNLDTGTVGQPMTLTTDPITAAGSYDFMAIDQGDYVGKTAPYSTSRTATVVNVNVTQYAPVGEPAIYITSNVADATITCGGTAGSSTYYGSATVYGNLGDTYTVTIESTGYTVYTTTGTFQTGTHNINATLSACSTSQVGCYGYKSGTTGGGSTGSTTTCSSTDYTCQIEQIATTYWPYLLAGGIVVLLALTSPPSGGHSAAPVIVEERSPQQQRYPTRNRSDEYDN